MKKIIWSPQAITSLQQLIHFIDDKWNKKVSDNLLNEIDKEVKRIRKNPFLYPLYSRKKDLRKCVIKKKTLLIYRVTLHEIAIVLLVDVRQNPNKFKL